MTRDFLVYVLHSRSHYNYSPCQEYLDVFDGERKHVHCRLLNTVCILNTHASGQLLKVEN